MKFLLDAHLPSASGIRAAGHECFEAIRLIPPDAPDLAIARLANELDAVLLSKDIDFVELASRGVLRTALVRIRLRSMTARATCDAVLPLLSSIIASIEAGERVIEIQ